MSIDFQYENLLRNVLAYGENRVDRTGTGTRSLWAPQPLTFALSNFRVPLITSKRVPWKMATKELMWMLRGETNIEGIRHPQMEAIWSAWADEHGDVGPTYGAQYRNAGGYMPALGGSGTDQLARVVHLLEKTPDTRRAVISLWGADELDFMGIEPCMVTLQFSLRGANYDQLYLQVYQRSADMMLGVPFDVYQMGLLTHLVARELALRGMRVFPTQLTWVAGDVHIYTNQIEAAQDQLHQHTSNLMPMTAQVAIDPFPSLRLLTNTLEAGHISIHDYFPNPAIDAGKPAV